jgi:hypothetical protein
MGRDEAMCPLLLNKSYNYTYLVTFYEDNMRSFSQISIDILYLHSPQHYHFGVFSNLDDLFHNIHIKERY